MTDSYKKEQKKNMILVKKKIRMERLVSWADLDFLIGPKNELSH